MTKYFMQGTAEELVIGDMIVLDFTKDMPDGKTKHHHLECKFIPELIPLLLKEGIIEKQEVNTPEEKESSEECDLSTILQEIIKLQEDLELRVDKLEELLLEVKTTVKTMTNHSRDAKKASRK